MLALALMVIPVCAEDWNVKGKDYHNVKVTDIADDSVAVIYDGGIGHFNLSDLSSDLQKRFNYDPIKAKQAIEEKARHEAQVAAEMLPALQEAADYKAQRKEYDAEVARIEDINQKNREYRDHGGAFAVTIYPIPEFRFRPPVDLTKPQDTSCRALQVLPDGFITSDLICKFGAYNLAFIKCNTTGMIDGQQWRGSMIPFNTYHYVNAAGSESTIACFTTDLSQTPSKPAPSNYVFSRPPVSSSMSVGGGN